MYEHVSVFVVLSLLEKQIFRIDKDLLRAIVDSVITYNIIIFKILNRDIVAMCIIGCGKKKFRNTPLMNNPVV
jgi:hypothetical protein